MSDKRKEIIVSEINFWKQNKMLPDHYCDFLLALYAEDASQGQATKSVLHQKPTFRRWWLLTLLVIPISLFVIYFTELSIVLQTAILTGFVVFIFSLGFYYSKKGISVTFFYIISALLLLLLPIHIIDVFFPNNAMFLFVALIINCLLWIFLGIKQKLLYFTLSGSIGIIIILYFIVR